MDSTDLHIYTTAQICAHVGGQLEGCGDLTIGGVEALHQAQPGQITFIGDEQHARCWPLSHATAALLGGGLEVPKREDQALIRVPDADLALVSVLELFGPAAPMVSPGTHSTAIVDPTVQLGGEVCVGPNSVVGPQVKIGSGTVLYANVTILDEVQIGANCVLWPGVVIRERCQVGDRCILHPNVTIGADGFGYRPSADGRRLTKIPHIGTVQIGHDVEIGAGTCVDRGKFSATRIGDGTKIDNQCQIAHNCQVGRGCILAGQVGLAGSVTVGDGVVMGGQLAVKEQLTIGAGAMLAACSGVMNDVPPGQRWGGMPAREYRTAMREQVAIRKLPDLIKDLRRIQDLSSS